MSGRRPYWGERITWPHELECPYCARGIMAYHATDDLEFWRGHAACIPSPVRDALEVGWGAEGVHGGGHDPVDMDQLVKDAWR